MEVKLLVKRLSSLVCFLYIGTVLMAPAIADPEVMFPTSRAENSLEEGSGVQPMDSARIQDWILEWQNEVVSELIQIRIQLNESNSEVQQLSSEFAQQKQTLQDTKVELRNATQELTRVNAAQTMWRRWVDQQVKKLSMESKSEIQKLTLRLAEATKNVADVKAELSNATLKLKEYKTMANERKTRVDAKI